MMRQRRSQVVGDAHNQFAAPQLLLAQFLNIAAQLRRHLVKVARKFAHLTLRLRLYSSRVITAGEHTRGRRQLRQRARDRAREKDGRARRDHRDNKGRDKDRAPRRGDKRRDRPLNCRTRCDEEYANHRAAALAAGVNWLRDKRLREQTPAKLIAHGNTALRLDQRLMQLAGIARLSRRIDEPQQKRCERPVCHTRRYRRIDDAVTLVQNDHQILLILCGAQRYRGQGQR